MQLQSSAPTNMLISDDLVEWANGVVTNPTIQGKIVPASSSDGSTFYALASTKGIDVEGSIIDASNRENVEIAEVDMYDDENTYFVVLPLYILATEETNKANDLELYLENFTVTTSTNHLEKVARVSITQVKIAGDALCTSNTGLITVNPDTGELTAANGELEVVSTEMYRFDAVTSVKPIESVDHGTPTLVATDPSITTSTQPEPTCFVVDKDGAFYTTIIVRIWLEGQHPNCINAAAGETINVSLGWRVKDQA